MDAALSAAPTRPLPRRPVVPRRPVPHAVSVSHTTLYDKR
jgi:hypothetical protein